MGGDHITDVVITDMVITDMVITISGGRSRVRRGQ
jgi:hypothetical protein